MSWTFLCTYLYHVTRSLHTNLGCQEVFLASVGDVTCCITWLLQWMAWGSCCLSTETSLWRSYVDVNLPGVWKAESLYARLLIYVTSRDATGPWISSSWVSHTAGSCLSDVIDLCREIRGSSCQQWLRFHCLTCEQKAYEIQSSLMIFFFKKAWRSVRQL